MICFPRSSPVAFDELFDGFPFKAYKTTYTDSPDLVRIDKLPSLCPPAVKDAGEILDGEQVLLEVNFVH